MARAETNGTRVPVAPLRVYLQRLYPPETLTARRIGELVGVAESRVWRWNGRGLTIDSARAAAEALGVEPQAIWPKHWRPVASADEKAAQYLEEITELTEEIKACSGTVRDRALVAIKARDAGVSVMDIATAAGIAHPTMLKQMGRYGT